MRFAEIFLQLGGVEHFSITLFATLQLLGWFCLNFLLLSWDLTILTLAIATIGFAVRRIR